MLRHTKLIAIHAPALTRICCLPILTYPSTGGFTRLGDHRVKSTIVGLFLSGLGKLMMHCIVELGSFHVIVRISKNSLKLSLNLKL